MLIDSGMNQKAQAYNMEEFLRAVKMAQAEELAAANTYDLLYTEIAAIKETLIKSKAPLCEEIMGRLAEIHADEINHAGSLQWIIENIDVLYRGKFEEGYKGEG